MDPMHEEEEDVLNAKAILLAVGGAAVAALLLVLARREGKTEPAAPVEAVIENVKEESRKAAKAAKKKRKALAAAAADTGSRLAHDVRQATGSIDFDAKAAERDLKAAAWDAQQEAREAEGKLRAAGHRVVEDATQLASWVGAEARSLAGEGKERIAHLRGRDDAEEPVSKEVARLRAEIEELRGQLGNVGKRAEKDYFGLTSRLSGKGGSVSETVASQAAVAALAQLERSLKAKAPALLAARNRQQVVEIIQQELGPTLRETMVQAATAALGKWESARDRVDGDEEPSDSDQSVADKLRSVFGESDREARETPRDAAEAARKDAEELAAAVHANGKRRLFGTHDAADEKASAAKQNAEEVKDRVAAEVVAHAEEPEHRGKAGLLWGGAGIGLALYALLDAERRENFLKLANEASIQVQELVRDLQGYDDEF